MPPVKLLIVDELGYVPLSQTGAELLFEIFSQRHEHGSTIVTSNLPFDEWTNVFGNQRLTGALLDFVVAHELLHLRVPNHGRLFKALMTAHVPCWRSFDVMR